MWFAVAVEQACILIGQDASVGDSINCIARIDLHCDWSFQIPVVNSHMLKFLSMAQGLCPYTPDPFSLAEGGIWERDY